MAKRIIYINPHDLIELRIITDPEIERNATEWKYQTRPESILLQYQGYKTLGFADPAIRCNFGAFTSPAAPTAEGEPK